MSTWFFNVQWVGSVVIFFTDLDDVWCVMCVLIMNIKVTPGQEHQEFKAGHLLIHTESRRAEKTTHMFSHGRWWSEEQAEDGGLGPEGRHADDGGLCHNTQWRLGGWRQRLIILKVVRSEEWEGRSSDDISTFQALQRLLLSELWVRQVDDVQIDLSLSLAWCRYRGESPQLYFVHFFTFDHNF